MNNDKKIYVKEIVVDGYSDVERVTPVDWTLDKEEADGQVGDYTEYPLDLGVELIVDAFDNYEYVGTVDNRWDYFVAVGKCSVDNGLEDVHFENYDCFIDDGEPHAYFIQNFDDGVSIHEFGEFNSLVGFNLNLRLWDIVEHEHMRCEWAKMAWLLGTDDYGEEELMIDMERRGYSSEDLISSKWFCCLEE